MNLDRQSGHIVGNAESRRRRMRDTEPQTAGGKVLLHFLITLDGFVAGPNHALDWMTGTAVRPGLHDEYIQTTGAIVARMAGPGRGRSSCSRIIPRTLHPPTE